MVSSNTSSERIRNLSDESIPVIKLIPVAEDNDPPSFDFSVAEIATLYLDK